MRFRKTENFHILLWLIKDACWAAHFKPLALFMIAPTISVAIWLTIRSKNIYHEFMHNLAVVMWITANSIWMIGELSGNSTSEEMLRQTSLYVFSAGLIIIAIYYFPVLFFKNNNKEI